MAQPYQYPQAPAPQYVAPAVTQVVVPQATNMSPTVTIGEWFILLLVEGLPIIGFIMMIVWAFDSTKPSRANFCKLQLIMMVIFFVIGIIIAILAAVGAVAFGDMRFN